MKTHVMVTVKGLVQGVNFRHYTQQTARRHNVNGWVRNLPDGSVQGYFEGDESDVMALVDWCRVGPSQARVDEVNIEQGEYAGNFQTFEIRR